MKAQLLYHVGDMRFEEIETPVPKADEVLLRVRAAGICGSDVPRTFETGAHKMPLIIGHEFSGEVVSTGSDISKEWMDKRVGVFPLIPCKKCPSCLNRQYEMCENYNYLGSRCNGGFAEYVAVPAWNLIPLDDAVTFEAAAMMEPMAVAVHAIRRSGLMLPVPDHGKMAKADDMMSGQILKDRTETPIVIWGLGTIGLLVAMFLKDAGYEKVFVVGNKPLQRRLAACVGLSEEFYFDAVAVEEAMNKGESTVQGLEKPAVFFECVGKVETLTAGLRLVKRGGCLVTVGNPASDMQIPKEAYWGILRKQLTVVGTWNSSFIGEAADDWHYVADTLASGRIKPEQLVTHKLVLPELYQGLCMMKDKCEPYCKVMIV